MLDKVGNQNVGFLVTRLISVLQVTIARDPETIHFLRCHAQWVISVPRVQLLLPSFPVQVSNITKIHPIKTKTKQKYTYAIYYDDFQMKNCDIFLIFAQNLDRGYKVDPPH